MSSSTQTSLLTILVLIYIVSAQHYRHDYGYDNRKVKRYTREIQIKQGKLQGVIVEPTVSRLPPVEMYLGIPYAAPPVGELRFMPPGSAPSWFHTRYADSFGPACPQTFPNDTNMSGDRKEYFKRLRNILISNPPQSEDCLYLNIYAPVQENFIAVVDGVRVSLLCNCFVCAPYNCILCKMDQYTSDLLAQWGLVEYTNIFNDARIDIFALQLIQVTDVDALIGPLGDRIRFRSNFKVWTEELDNPNAVEIPCRETSIKENLVPNTEDIFNLHGDRDRDNSVLVILEKTAEGKAILSQGRKLKENNIRFLIC